MFVPSGSLRFYSEAWLSVFRMYRSFRVLLQVLWAQLLCGWVLGSELTFELPDNAKQCFYEDVIVGTKCTLEFQVR